MWLIALVLMVSTIMCRSGNGVLLLGIGIVVLFACKWLRSPVPLLILALIAPIYITVRATNLWDGKSLVSIFGFDQQRSGSLNVRMEQEKVYTEQALKRPFFGWGGGGFIPRDEFGKKLVRVNDAFWIITFGMYGLVSLVSVFLAMFLAPLILIRRLPISQWSSPVVAPTVALVIVITLFAMDCLLNAMLNPIYVLALGGICGISQAPRMVRVQAINRPEVRTNNRIPAGQMRAR